MAIYQQMSQNNYEWLVSNYNQAIVLIGLNTDKLKDNHRIPLNTMHHSKPGALIHATALKSIVSGNSFEVVPEYFQYALFLVITFCFSGVFSFYHLQKPFPCLLPLP